MRDIEAMHANGVHTHCRLPRKRWAGKYIGDGTSTSCARAGTVDRLHGHDFDGPLWDACRCAD